ncbi:MAG: hypothetical protein ACREUU_08630, partial [Gammaproteobacteria bacterium]
MMIASLGLVGLAPSLGSGGNRRPAEIEDPVVTSPTPSNVLTFPDGPRPTIDGTKPHVAII